MVCRRQHAGCLWIAILPTSVPNGKSNPLERRNRKPIRCHRSRPIASASCDSRSIFRALRYKSAVSAYNRAQDFAGVRNSAATSNRGALVSEVKSNLSEKLPPASLQDGSLPASEHRSRCRFLQPTIASQPRLVRRASRDRAQRHVPGWFSSSIIRRRSVSVGIGFMGARTVPRRPAHHAAS